MKKKPTIQAHKTKNEKSFQIHSHEYTVLYQYILKRLARSVIFRTTELVRSMQVSIVLIYFLCIRVDLIII